MRGEQLSRLFKILRLLEKRKRGVTARQLSAELGVKLRTVYRDLEALEAAQFPLYAERDGKRSYWRFVDSYRSGLSIPFTTSELMALHLSRDLLRVFDGTVVHESIESLFSKVQDSLNPETVRYVRALSAGIRVGLGPRKRFSEFSDIVAQVSEAASRRKTLRINYMALSSGDLTERLVEPYVVWIMNGSMYLIAHCHLRNAVRTFWVDRIKKVRLLDESFEIPRDFSLDDYLQTAFRVMRGKPEVVKVWFAPGAAGVVQERIWHPTQEIREHEEGGLVITMEVPINYEIISWILGFGSAAQVLLPASLGHRITRELEASLDRYRASGEAQTKIVSGQKIPATLS